MFQKLGNNLVINIIEIERLNAAGVLSYLYSDIAPILKFNTYLNQSNQTWFGHHMRWIALNSLYIQTL